MRRHGASSHGWGGLLQALGHSGSQLKRPYRDFKALAEGYGALRGRGCEQPLRRLRKLDVTRSTVWGGGAATLPCRRERPSIFDRLRRSTRTESGVGELRFGEPTTVWPSPRGYPAGWRVEVVSSPYKSTGSCHADRTSEARCDECKGPWRGGLAPRDAA